MFKGVFTALITPFKDNGDIDETALRKLVDFQLENGINGIVPMGTTGESPALNHDEHIKTISIVTEQVNGRVPVIAGTGSNCTREAINLTKRAKDTGVTASLQVAPYYNKPTQEGFYRHFMEIAESVDIPVIIYNIPSRTSKNIENSTTLRLAEHPNIIGVKEASGDINQMMDLILKKPESFTVLSGDDNLTYPLMALGGNGVVSVASNIIPGRMVSFCDAALKGDYPAARKMHYELFPLFKALFLETNPIPVKAALALMGKIKEVYRLPMCPMLKENKEKLITVLKQYNLI
ncbi:MAG: 4-hydroxy-tetrahydrodipicolinate synthase [Spirochaetales bacterium]|nr:4-hydroxy-tetrahydrodipicolinate synthase [Spirochaetales bacterium]